MDTTIVTILVLIFAVISICVPFYILKIRNQVVQINKTMTTMARHLKMMAEGTKSAR